jgi:hypothetical protein
MAPTLTDLPNELLHHILGMKAGKIHRKRYASIDEMMEHSKIFKSQAAVVRNLRATCRQLRRALQDIFVDADFTGIAFALTMDDIAILSDLPSQHCPENASIGPRTWTRRQKHQVATSGEIPSASAVATVVNKWANLRSIQVFDRQVGFVSDSYYQTLLNGLTLCNLDSIEIDNFEVSALALIGFICRQSRLRYVNMNYLDLTSGSWEHVLAACAALPIKAFVWKDPIEKGEMLWFEGDGDQPPEMLLYNDDAFDGKGLAIEQTPDGYYWRFETRSDAERREYLNLFIALYRLQRFRLSRALEDTDEEADDE